MNVELNLLDKEFTYSNDWHLKIETLCWRILLFDFKAPVAGMDKVICIGMNYKDHCEEQVGYVNMCVFERWRESAKEKIERYIDEYVGR